MQKLDRYLVHEFVSAFFAALVILLMVMLGGALIDVLKNITSGKLPASVMLAQIGLVVIGWLPLILPLALMLGLLLAVSRLYRDAEMPVLASLGLGPERLLKPLMLLVAPVVALVAACSLWLGPWAERYARELAYEAGRNMLISGLEPGAFTELPGGGVVFVGDMSEDGSRFGKVFIYREKKGRIDVTSSANGALWVANDRTRYLRLENGYEVEGPADGQTLDFRMLEYKTNDVRMHDRDDNNPANELRRQPTGTLLANGSRQAKAELHRRIAPPFIALALALLAIPLARSPPRQARYGRVVTGFLGYLLTVLLMTLGTQKLAVGKLPMPLGLWWLVLPLLAAGLWFYFRDGSLRRLRR